MTITRFGLEDDESLVDVSEYGDCWLIAARKTQLLLPLVGFFSWKRIPLREDVERT